MMEIAIARPRPAQPGLSEDGLWYKDAIIYQLHIKSFFDANNDGVGDFPGLLSKLDYIADLGVNTIWLLPFYPSPRRTAASTSATTAGCIPITARCTMSNGSSPPRITEACGSSPSWW